MARLRNILALLLAVVMLAGCNKKVEWNQKLIVNVVTPEGLKTASSVITVMIQENKFFFDFLTPPEGRGVGTHVRGEAVVIEVKPGSFPGLSLSKRVVLFSSEGVYWFSGNVTTKRFGKGH